VNFVTCHDGFTLTDLVSFNERHNEANGEQNADGAADNSSTNCGAEGPTESARILRLRERMKRNLLSSLMFSQGVRMLLGGDEFGRSQSGNNNAYCQDNEISWYDWGLDESGRELLAFTRNLISIVAANPVLRRRDFFGAEDVIWLRSDGTTMTDEDWKDASARSIGMLMSGRAADEVDARGRTLRGDTLLLLLNAGGQSKSYTLPKLEIPGMWEELLNTSRSGTRVTGSPAVNLASRSTILLRHADRRS
jgi:glycogen operon protein